MQRLHAKWSAKKIFIIFDLNTVRMNFLSNLFGPKTTRQNSTGMNGKEKQLAFIKDALKPLFKAEGYKTIGNKWWKLNGRFFNLIELQNFSWNSGNSVDFCFNFTTGFVDDIKNPDKPTIHDGIPYIREGYFKVLKNEYWREGNGYHLDDNTDLNKFTEQVVSDFKLLILPKFDILTDEDSIESFYSDGFWASRVKQSLARGTKMSASKTTTNKP